MSTCVRCSALDGKPVRSAPHDGLRSERTLIGGEAETETYTCRTCGTKWLRVIPKPPDREALFWRAVGHFPQLI